MLPRKRWLLGFGILVAAFGATLPVFAQTGGITGFAKDEKGNLLPGHPILIERVEIKAIYKTKTNKKGEYIYIGLQPGNYKVTLQDPNGRTLYYFNSQHISIGDPTEVNFDLGKERAQQQKEQASNPEIQKQQQELAKSEKQSANLKQLFDQGQALFGDKKYAEAAAVFEQALPLATGNNLPIVLSRVAESHAKARQFDKAVEAYQKALAANPNDSDLHNGLGNVYAEMNKTAEAQAEFQKSAELNPAGASRAYYNLGVVMYNKGNMDQAGDAFKKAVQIDPTFADAYFLEGQALASKLNLAPDGKVIVPPGYVEAYQTYLKLEPNGKHAAEAQGALQAVQGQIQTEIKVEKKKKKP